MGRTLDGAPRGYGFITFDDKEDANYVLTQTLTLNGQLLIMKPANPKKPMSSGKKKTHDDKDAIRLFVHGISPTTRPCDIQEIFEQYGYVKNVYIPKNFKTGKPREFAYLQFNDLECAKNAIKGCNHYVLDGHKLSVQFAVGERKTPKEMNSHPVDI